MLFNKDDKGSEEIKGIIGWIYKSNSYENLATYLQIAKRYIVGIIGSEIYDLALNHYLGENYEQDLQESEEPYVLLDQLVHMIQLPLALLAYRKYAPGVDIQHSEQGRHIIVTENQKPAFEWMLQRDNNNIMDLFHESIDMLLEFLDVQALAIEDTEPAPEEPAPEEPAPEEPDGQDDTAIGITWAGSQAYKNSKSVILCTALMFDSVYPINQSRRLYVAFLPFIKEVENRFIKPIITPTRYDAIIEKRLDGDLEETDLKIIELCLVPSGLLTMSVALKRLSIEVLPDSVVQSYTSFDPKQTRVADSLDRRGLSVQLELDAKRELIALQKYIISLTPVVAAEEEEIDTTKPFFMA